jgi:hypothetical protein
MDPSWDNFRKVIRRHEEITQSINLSLHHLSIKFRDFKKALDNLTISKNKEK